MDAVCEGSVLSYRASWFRLWGFREGRAGSGLRYSGLGFGQLAMRAMVVPKNMFDEGGRKEP